MSNDEDVTGEAVVSAQYQQALGVQQSVQEQLLERPDVNGVGVGVKLRNGAPTGETALLIAVTRKRPLDELAPEEIIPPAINGIKTDVIEAGPFTLAEDTGKYRPVKGGVQIEVEGKNSYGTLGGFARTRGQNPKVVLLTNQHVLFREQNTTSLSRAVGNPTSTECSSCSECLTDAFATIEHPAVLSPLVDGATAVLRPGTQWLAEVLEIGTVTGTHPLTAAEVQSGNYRVQKRGRTTELTAGTVISNTFSGQVKMSNGNVHRNYINSILIIKSGGDNFADRGDSGSLVLNTNREAIGLLFGKDANGNGLACRIEAVLDALQIDLATTVTANEVQTIPTPPKTPPKTLVPREPVVVTAATAVPAAVPLQSDAVARLRQVEQDLSETAGGQRWVALVRQHAPEIARLVNHNRRVLVTWQRKRGPAFVAAFLRAAAQPEQPLRTVIEGVTLSNLLTHMSVALEEQGSAELIQALHAHFFELMTFANTSVSLSAIFDQIKAGSALSEAPDASTGSA